MNRISALQVETTESSLAFPVIWDYNEKSVIYNPEEDFMPELDHTGPWAWTSSLQNCEE